MRSVRKKRAQDKMIYRLRQESIKAANRARYWANPEKHRERSREYSRISYWNNPCKKRELGRKSYWKKKAVSGQVGKTLVENGQSPSPSNTTTWPATADPGITPARSTTTRSGDITTWPATADPGTTPARSTTTRSGDVTTWPATADPGTTPAHSTTTRSGDTTTKASCSNHQYRESNNPYVSLHYFHLRYLCD